MEHPNKELKLLIEIMREVHSEDVFLLFQVHLCIARYFLF
jgi:hypothetical protein